MHGCEMHVFTLLETIRHQWRLGRDVYALFVDFRKAYDMVHQDALWAVLRHAGVPDRLVGLLANWHRVRTTALHINGTVSERFPYTKGVPQGEITSCILFIIFIESLARFLKSRPDLHGIDLSTASVRLIILLLLYADDLVMLARTPAELQRALTHIHEWAQLWGFQLGIGTGKTEAVAFIAAARSAAEPPPAVTGLPALTCPAGLVPWGTSYTYLGHLLHWNLSTDDLITRRVTRLKMLLNAAFLYNRLIRGMSLAAQIQIMNTVTTGCMNYLFSILPLSAAQAGALDTQLRKAARVILGLPMQSPNGLVIAEAGLLLAPAHSAMHHQRFLHTLQLTPYSSGIAATLLRVLSQQRRVGRGVTQSWLRATTLQLNEAVQSGAIRPQPTSVHDLPLHLSRFSRSLSYVQWRRELCHGVGMNTLRNDRRIVTSADRPPSFPPRAHAASLYFRATLPPTAAHGLHAQMLPLTYCGPRGGTAVARSTVPARLHAIICTAKLGSVALLRYPFRRARGRYNDDDGISVNGIQEGGDDDFITADDTDDWSSAVPCVFCGSDAADVWHLASECRSDALTALQLAVRKEVPRILARALRQLLESALRHLTGDAPAILEAHVDAALAAIDGVDWESAEGRFLIHRTLTVLPFAPEYVHASMPRAHSLAAALHAVCLLKHASRSAYTAWTISASRLLHRIADTWRMHAPRPRRDSTQQPVQQLLQ